MFSRATFVVASVLLCAASAQWTDLWKFPWSGTPMELMLGIACPNTTTCYFTGSHGDDAISVYYTNDNFQTVNPCNVNAGTLMLLSMAYGSNTNLVAAGLGALKDPGVLYTKDGMNWNGGNDENLIVGQDVEAFGPEGFGYIGTTNTITNKEGVLVSKNGGETWKAFDWGKLNIPAGTEARYGAFPTASTWYVSGGSWPGNSSKLSAHHRDVTHTLTFDRVHKKYVTRKVQPQKPSANNGYIAVITKTTDAGETWTVQYTNLNDFYFNDICCWDANTCFAVGEGFTDGNSPGSRIFGTTNGGSTWTQVFLSTANDASMMMCRMVSATEAWTTGTAGAGAIFYHTTNGGQTWTSADAMSGVGAVIGLTMVNANLGYATAITELQKSTILKFSS